MMTFLAQIKTCLILIFIMVMIRFPRKSAVTKNLKFNFLNFTENYVTTVRFFQLLKVSRFDAL